MSDANPGDSVEIVCPGCHAVVVPTRPGHTCCSVACRQRKKRGTYVVTAEDRAAMARARARVPIPVPRIHPDDLREHIASTAVVNGDEP
jgi:hypothetical protein